ncbi:YcxB family protein [Bosea sp. 685]|uniref:YcxB family protein n=1 Tax=Bosea sp. 685 TaxID=3080057 RepID=UPI002892EA12|nr:YcxB family protein [Bosea sp. 685]WNJ89094.1 YcxB family protein [Bosea sp. 685]
MADPSLADAAAHAKALRAAGFETPILLHYVIEADGLTTREPQRESVTPWSQISRLDEGRDHLFFVLPSQEETVALPKRAISAGQIDTLRRWLEQRIGVTQLLPEPPAPPENALSFEVVMEPKDWAAHVAWYQDLPALRRSRQWGIIRNWLLASLAVPILTIAAWALDTERLPVSLSLPIFWALFPSFFWKPALAFGVLAALRLAFDRPLMRWFAGHSGAMLYKSTRKTPNRFMVDDSGILTFKGAATTFVKWPGVIGLARRPEHWLVRISRGSTLIVPRRALDPAQAERFEALCSRHVQRA